MKKKDLYLPTITLNPHREQCLFEGDPCSLRFIYTCFKLTDMKKQQ